MELSLYPIYKHSIIEIIECKGVNKGVPLAMALAPMITHQALAYEIAFELKSSSRDCKQSLVFGEADWKINDDTVVKLDETYL